MKEDNPFDFRNSYPEDINDINDYTAEEAYELGAAAGLADVHSRLRLLDKIIEKSSNVTITPDLLKNKPYRADMVSTVYIKSIRDKLKNNIV